MKNENEKGNILSKYSRFFEKIVNSWEKERKKNPHIWALILVSQHLFKN
jgi:hypothetical protein